MTAPAAPVLMTVRRVYLESLMPAAGKGPGRGEPARQSRRPLVLRRRSPPGSLALAEAPLLLEPPLPRRARRSRGPPRPRGAGRRRGPRAPRRGRRRGEPRAQPLERNLPVAHLAARVLRYRRD